MARCTTQAPCTQHGCTMQALTCSSHYGPDHIMTPATVIRGQLGYLTLHITRCINM
jgi:hypothetical protein